MTTINRQKPVLVTGASGYVAGWIVKQLLEQGLTVHATVRDVTNSKNYQHLQKIADESNGTIHFFSADLLKEGSFDAAIKDCELVFHTASPFIFTGYKDAEAEIVKPALEGTKNLLNSVNRTESVKRVVLTSSIASTFGDAIEITKKASGMFDENDWNTTSNLKHQPYPYSKVIAEREAWKMVEQQSRWELVCINPALVVGPSLTRSSNSYSMDMIKQFGDGRTLFGVPDLSIGLVDVRDVATAHFNAGFNPTAHGRYIIAADNLNLLQIGKALRQKFGYRYPFPHFTVPKAVFVTIAPLVGVTSKFAKLNAGYTLKFNHQRSQKELGISYRDVKTSLTEQFEQMLDDGLIKRR